MSRRSVLTLSRAVDRWLAHLELIESRRPRGVQTYRQVLDQLLDVLGTDTDPRTIEHGDLLDVIASWGRIQPSTRASRISVLRSFGAWLADELDMHEFLDRRCDKFSTGMKQKTSIARTLIHDPAVMIFDEPTLGLDVMTARTIARIVRECRDRGKTVIYSTHVMSEVEKLCDVIGIIHGGRLVAEGTLAELQARFGEKDMEEIFVQAVGGEAAVAEALKN